MGILSSGPESFFLKVEYTAHNENGGGSRRWQNFSTKSWTMTFEVYQKFELAVLVLKNMFPFPVCMGQKVGDFLTIGDRQRIDQWVFRI